MRPASFCSRPMAWISALPLEALRAEHDLAVGITFLVATSLFVAHITMDATPPVSKRLASWYRSVVFLYKWQRLNDRQKAILSYCVSRHERNFPAPRFSESVQRLIDVGLVEAGEHGVDLCWFYEIEWDAYATMQRHRLMVRHHLDDWKEIEDKREALEMLDQARARASKHTWY